ncbi:uncharacterized protein ELE39_003117 [Cryptosporidium sp. chipmunk genotype I]|uniref:uncharacterized protein n=1 Tax=Cryptosporidium sp. chipmunk genotype I TaxID=1280935 RepID=UPI00351AA479|nr:hypothetical protein ELE39_003117 [Cryptosporidium sp. chipmunk genotype I]
MKSTFICLLIALSIFSYANASPPKEFDELKQEVERLRQQVMSISLDSEKIRQESMDIATKCEKIRDSVLLDGKLLLMAIEQGKKILEIPLLGTYQSEGECMHTRLFFFDTTTKLFLVSELSCENKTLSIEGVNGQFKLIIKDAERLRKKSKSKSYIRVETNFSCTTRTLSLEQISDCPSILKNFNVNMIPENFNIETDQQYITGTQFYHRGFYFSNTRKSEKMDSEKVLTYALFNSKSLFYAIPIQIGCKCALKEYTNIVCKCDDLDYEFDAENGILSVNKVKFLTSNIRGLKVLTAETCTQLFALIDIKTQEQENEKLEVQL